MSKLVCALALLLTLVGCVDQQKEVNTYRQVLDEDVPAPVTCDPNAALSLHQAMALANLHNERLAISGEDYLQALIDKDRAFAAFLPVIGLAPTYFQQDKYAPGGIAGFLAPSVPSRTFDLPLNAQINVFNGFRDVAAIRQAAANIQTRRALLLDLQQNILLEVAQAYYQILRAEQQVDVLKNSVAVQEDRVRDMQTRQKVGLARLLDVSQTEAQASGTRVMLIRAKNDAQNGRAVLAFLIGQPCVAGPLIDQFVIPEKILGELQTIAAANRRDIQAAESQISAAQQNLLAAVRQYLPSAGLNVNYFITRQSLPKEVDWNGFININVPIFTGGRIEANIRTAWSVLRQARLNESLIRRRVNEDVQIALQNFEAGGARLRELAVELQAADDAYRQAVESFKVGLATNLEQLIAQDRLLIAQLQYTSEKLNRKILYLNLQKAIGRLAVPSATTRPTTTTSAPAKYTPDSSSTTISHTQPSRSVPPIQTAVSSR